VQAERLVHIVDDDAPLRRSLERLLHSAGFATLVYETAQAVLDGALGLLAGCILLDVLMPGMGGVELQARLNDLDVRLPVIVMTGHGDVQTAVLAMKAGAVDFIEKPFDDERLLATIEAALAGAGDMTRHREMAQAATQIATLSRRERQVLDALVAGHPSKVIAYDLAISIRTVEVHRTRMLERLGTRRIAEAIRLAVLATLATSGGPGRRLS
jgi:two-component system response regulator FixJ